MEIERRQYPKQFKDEAVRLVLEQGYTCGKAGEQLGVPAKTLANGVRPLRKGATIGVRPPSAWPATTRRRSGPGSSSWSKHLRRTEMEREVLKKATACFAKENA